jgi:hypothetical protein
MSNDGDAPHGAKSAPQSGDVAGAGVTDGGAVGRKKRFETPVETRNGWEIFHDRSTWDLIAVRPIGNRVYGDAVHFETWQDAREYADATPSPQDRSTPTASPGPSDAAAIRPSPTTTTNAGE